MVRQRLSPFLQDALVHWVSAHFQRGVHGFSSMHTCPRRPNMFTLLKLNCLKGLIHPSTPPARWIAHRLQVLTRANQ